MIARRAAARKRRTEVREHMTRAAEAAARVYAPRYRQASMDREAGGADIQRLARALAELGTVFAAYGVYLASRGDLLASADRRRLSALDRAVPPLPPADIREILRAEIGRDAPGRPEPSRQ